MVDLRAGGEARRRVLLLADQSLVIGEITAALVDTDVLVDGVGDEARAVALVRQVDPDIVLVEVTVPHRLGLAVCRSLRASGFERPIVAVAIEASEIDLVLALELGADDYVCRLDRHRELVARLDAQLRRATSTAAPATVHEVGCVRIDVERHEVWVHRRPLVITHMEFVLLETLLARAGHLVTRHQLIERMWPNPQYTEGALLNNHVKRLRRKLGPEPVAEGGGIVTVPGRGYRYQVSHRHADHAHQRGLIGHPV